MNSAKDYLQWGAGFVAGVAASLNPVFLTLCGLVAVDVLTGLLSAYVRKEVTSEATFRGGAKKALILTLSLSGGMMTRIVNVGIDLGAALSAYYCVHEAISILENVSKAGVPLPGWLTAALKDEQKKNL
jgi:toxin secretion/phage lysis holin